MSVLLFCRLPQELQHLVLSYMDRNSLDRLFDLQGLVLDPQVPDPFLLCRHRALVAKHKQNLIFSNLCLKLSVSLQELHYLMDQRIEICPRSLSLLVFLGFSDLCPRRFHQYLRYFQSPSQDVHFSLASHAKHGLDHVVHSAVNFVGSAGLVISSMAVRHLSSHIHRIRTESTPEHFSTGISAETSADIGTQTSGESREPNPRQSILELPSLVLFLLNLFAPNLLPQLLHAYTTSALQELNLAFSQITEWHLSQIHLPLTLKTLNLSNNQLHVLSNDTLALLQLPLLESLDLSNNNLMRIEAFDGHGSLASLDLSGNLLQDYSALFKCQYFSNLESLDLSRNLLDSLTEIPKSVNRVGLTGNYFQSSAKRPYAE